MKQPGTAFVALAAMFWGLSGGIGGILTAQGWGSFEVSFYRGAIGLLFVVAWLALRPFNSGMACWRFWFWSAVAGIGVAGNFSFYFVSITEGSVAVAASLMYCAPIFVYLVSFALKIEKPTLWKWGAIALVMLGIMLLTRIYDMTDTSVTATGIGAGLLAGMSYALFIFGFKYAATHGTPQAILVIAFSVLVLILIWPSDYNQILAVPGAQHWPLFILLGVLGAGLSFILYIIGLNNTTPAVASIVAMVEPVTASLFGYLILNESLMGSQIIGMALILFTVTAMGVYSGARPASSATTTD